MDLKKIAAQSSSVPVEWQGQTMQVTYSPSVLTAEKIAQLSEKEAEGADDAILELLSAVVKTWDLKEGQKKVPVTIAAMRKVPLPLLRATFRAILRDASNSGEA